MMRNILFFSRRHVGVQLHRWKLLRWLIQATTKSTFLKSCCFIPVPVSLIINKQ